METPFAYGKSWQLSYLEGDHSCSIDWFLAKLLLQLFGQLELYTLPSSIRSCAPLSYYLTISTIIMIITKKKKKRRRRRRGRGNMGKRREESDVILLTFDYDGQGDHDITITIRMLVVSQRRHLIPQDPSRLQLCSRRPGSPGCGMRLKPRPSRGLQLMGDADEIRTLVVWQESSWFLWMFIP